MSAMPRRIALIVAMMLILITIAAATTFPMIPNGASGPMVPNGSVAPTPPPAGCDGSINLAAGCVQPMLGGL